MKIGNYEVDDYAWATIMLYLKSSFHQSASPMMSRAHSFPRPAEFPRNLGFLLRNLSRGINRGIRLFPRYFVFPAEFDVFHSHNYFFTENDLKVALLQVCL